MSPRQVAEATAPLQNFSVFEQWSKSPARAEADSIIRQNGGAELSAQDMELMRRILFLSGDNKAINARQLVADVVKQLQDPQNGQATRAQLWAAQAQMFGGEFLDGLPQDLKARAEGLVRIPAREPAPYQNLVPTPPSSSKPTDQMAAPITPPPAAASSTNGQEVDLPKPVTDIIENEFLELVKDGKGLVAFDAIKPMLKKFNVSDEAVTSLEKLLERDGKDKNMSLSDYKMIRFLAAEHALGERIRDKTPDITEDQFQKLLNDSIFKFIEDTKDDLILNDNML